MSNIYILSTRPDSRNNTIKFVTRVWMLTCFLLSATCLNTLQAQLTGTKNIPGDYATLSLAIADLNTQGVGAGGVTFNVLGGNPQSVPAGGYVIGDVGSAILAGANATSVTRQVTITGNGNSLTANAALTVGSLTDAIFKLIGADWIKIQGFVMLENAGNVINTPAANNNMTEWGVAFLYVSPTDGAQNNTIENNTITLNRTYQNSIGVYSNVRHSSTDVLTLADITDPTTGPNHSNKVYGNNINNVNIGMIFIGSATAANMDNANDIGGAASGTGNMVTNYGGLGALSAFNGFPTTIVSGAYILNQTNFNLSFNSFISASLNTAVALRGILTDYSSLPLGTITNNVNSNTVTFTQAGTGTFQCITTASAAGAAAGVTLNLNSNLIINNAVTGVNSALTIFGVANLGAFGTVNMNSNIVRANTSTATSGGLIGVTQQGAVITTVNMNNNQIGDAIAGAATFTSATTGQINPILNTAGAATATVNINNNVIRGFSMVSSGQVTAVSNQAAAVGVAINIKDNQIGTATADCYTYSAASAGAFVPIFNSNGAATALLTITGNDIRRINNMVTGSGTHLYIQNQTFTGSNVISNNTFTNITANTTGSVTFIGNSISRSASAVTTVNNNTVVTGYNKTGAGGTILFYNSFATSPITASETNTGNNFSNMTFTGAATITGWRCSDGTGVTGCPKTVTNNTFDNITAGTSAVTILQCSFGSTGTISGNTITNISAAAAITGFTSSSGNNTISQNTIRGLSSTVGAVVGLSITGATGSTQSVLKNKIGNLQSNNATGTVNGILVSGGITVNLVNNLIGDLRAPATSSTVDAIRGISLTSTTGASSINVYNNSIYINAQSTGANFTTSGIFHTTSGTATTAALDMRNNVIVNNSTANGTGFTAAYRRSSAILTNYAATSNNNLFWAGGVGSCTNRFIYHDGVAGLQLAPFQALVAPRETVSVTEDPQFTSTAVTSANFLHINPAVPTQIESGGAPIGSVTDDFDGDARNGATPDIGADEFSGITAMACAGTPVAGLLSPASSTICNGQSANLCLSGQTPPTGVTMQWQTSLVSGGPYTDIACGRANCYNTAPLTPGTYYYIVVVTCNNSGLTATSNQVTVIVNPNPTAAVMPPTANVCLGASIVLTASGGATYSWAPPTGLNTTMGDMVTATPLVTTTYTVTVSDVAGCSATATSVLTVLPAPTGVTASATPSSICVGANSQLNSTACLGLPSSAYTLSSLTSQTYTPLTGGGITIINTNGQLTPGFGDVTQDDGGVVITLPFPFTYNCNTFTQMSMSTNGWVGAGNQGTIDALNSRTPGNLFTTTIPNNTIGAWFKDMGANFPLGTGSMRHGLIGTDVYAFQWDNAIGSGFTDGSTITISFQVNIYGPTSGTPGRVELIYGPTVGTITTAAALGIEDAVGGATHFINALNGSNTLTTTSTAWPGNGNGFRFEPVVPTYSWTPPTFLNNSTIANPLASGVTTTTTYTVTVSGANGCSTTASTTVTVNPQLFTVTGGGAYCPGGAGLPVGLNGSQVGANYQLQLNGGNIGATVPGTGAAISFGNQTGTGTYTVIGTHTASGCTATMTGSVAISFNPVPIIASVLTQPTTCASNDGAIDLTISGAVGPYTYNWSTPNGSGLVNGQEDQAGLSVGNYLVTVTAANGCTATASISLPGPGGCSICPTLGTFTSVPVGQVCAGATFTLTQSGLMDMGTTYGIIFKYSLVALPDPYVGGTTLATIANGSLTGGGTTASAVVSIPTSGTYFIYAILTPTPLDPTCRPVSTLNLTVNPIPTATAAPVTQTICSGNAITTIVWSGPVMGTVFNWTRNNTVNVTGIAAAGSGNVIGNLTNTTNVPQTTIFTVTPVANGCSGNSSTTATVIVNPTPNAVATPAAQTICSGATITTMVLSGNVAGTVFNWTRNNAATVTGIAAAGSGNITGALTNTTNAPITVTFTITPTVNGCPGTAITATILVNPTPLPFTVTGGGGYCVGGPGAPVGLSGSQTNVNYQLRLNAVNTGAPVAGTGMAITFGPQLGIGTYTVVATSTQGACTANMTGSVVVSSFNCNIAISDPCVCKNNATNLINGQFDETIKINAPGTQIWTVAAVTGLYLATSPAPPAAPTPMPVGTVLTNLGAAMNMFELKGIHVDALGYSVTVTNNAGTTLSIGNACSYPNPSITSDLSPNFCLFSDPITLVGNPGDANIVSQTFTVNGVPATQFNPAQGIGSYTIVYTVNGGVPKAFGPNDPGCIQSVSMIAHVVATPAVLNCNDLVNISLPASCDGEVRPDDVLEGTYGCFDDYIVELDRIAPFGNGPWTSALLTAADIGKTYQYRVTHLGSSNNCWGSVKIEDKLPPTLSCVDIHLICPITTYDPGYLQNVLGITTAYPTITDCSNFTSGYTDTWVDLACSGTINGQGNISAYVLRKWTATDVWGNSTTCNQYIYFDRRHVSDVFFPADFTIQCNDNINTSPSVTGAPYVVAFNRQWPIYPNGGFCEMQAAYSDQILPVCDGTYKILRTWTVLDWCLPTSPNPPYNPLYYIQLIKVTDETGPALTCPANTTVSIDPFQCCSTVDMPDMVIEDACSRINNIGGMVVTFDQYTGQQTGMHVFGGTLTDFPGNNWWDRDTMARWGVTPCLPIGSHTVTYFAQDDCSNSSTCTFRLTVADYVPPVAACDQTTVVGIGVDDLQDCYEPIDGCDGAGVTYVKASTFDDGSFDDCHNVKLTIRRMAPYSDCITSLSQLPCYPNGDSEYGRATAESDSIKFYCCEVGTVQTVILRVYQVDVNGNLMNGPDGSPIYNECMIQVTVQDKVKPICQSPAHVTVSCEQFDPSLWVYGKANIFDNCCLDTTKTYQGQCGLTHSVSYTQFDTLCSKGTIVRTFRAFDCHGQSSQCTQRIVVNYEQDYFVRFPNDVIVTVCNGTGIYGEPTFFGKDCELLGVSYEDQIFTVVPDACFKIERNWKIINWCTYNPNAGCINVPNPNPNAISNHASNLPGPIVSPIQTTGDPWKSTIVAIAPGQTPTNYSTFYDPNANCYTYKQIIKIIDTQAPVVDCPASPVTICDLTPNDAQLWNQSYWWDNANQSHDLCEAPSDICITATDLCSGANINIEYQLFLDLDGDGVMETVVNSTQLGNQQGGLGWNNILYGNFTGVGVPRQFDGRPVATNQKWGFAIQETVSGVNKTACVKFNTFQSQNTFVTPQLPHGNHKIKWIVSDGCGNEKVCEYTIVIKDCKAPTVVCLNGLSVNIMPTGMIQLWATDFLQYAEDNCTLTPYLKYGIRKCGTGTGFPVDAQGNPITNVTFDCTELGTQCVELWSIDLAGNADFCETYVIVQDNAGNCGANGTVSVSGTLKTEPAGGAEGIAEVMVNGHLSTNAGLYMVNNLMPGTDVVIAPAKDDNPLNGVTTYDLVLISKHILGIEPLGTPYKMIAADANKSNSITTFDIVEIRKLILGIYQELPNNTSWRFVDKAYNFPNPLNPFMDAIPEIKSIPNIQTSVMNQDFVGVKIGDVNNTVVANSLMVSDDRTVGTLLFDLQDRDVKAGETFEVAFTAADKTQGFQMTLNLNGLEVADLENSDHVNANNFGVHPDALTVSIDKADVFTVTFRATKAGKLSEMLAVSSRITKAEAYSLKNDRLEVALRFDGKTIAGIGFELYQNQPNPFVNKTFVGFNLPAAATATLTVYDEMGRVVFTQKGDFAKGYNGISLDRALISTTGVLYYTLETATDAATKKMIQAK